MTSLLKVGKLSFTVFHPNFYNPKHTDFLELMWQLINEQTVELNHGVGGSTVNLIIIPSLSMQCKGKQPLQCFRLP